MKICWDNLEKLEYRPDLHGWQLDNRQICFYKDSCLTCGEPFLGRKEGLYCSYSCAKKGFKHSDETKRKLREINLGRKDSDEIRNKKGRPGISHYNWKGGVTEKDIVLYDTFADRISFCESVRRNKNIGKSSIQKQFIKQKWGNLDILEIKCTYCGNWFIPTRLQVTNRIRSLDGQITGEGRFYCSDDCKQECPIYQQKLWPKGFKPATSREVQPELRQMCFKRDDYICQKCGKSQDELDVGLQCHHIEGIRWEPLESADLDKVITFCKICHIEVHKQPDCGYYDLRCKEEKYA